MKNGERKERMFTTYSTNELFIETAGAFAENLIAKAVPTETIRNSFGRPIQVSSTTNLERLLGIASTGVRCAALIDRKDLASNTHVLEQFYRLHVPFTLVVDGNALSDLPEISKIGCIAFQATDYQSLADRILQAQVISEKTLIPVIVMAYNLHGNEVSIPRKAEIQQWFGDPDGKTEEPTPAQSILMGSHRRRMPAWIQADMPVMLGGVKETKDMAYEKAARFLYERTHIESLIDDSEREYEALVGRKLSSYKVYGHHSGRKLIVTDITNVELLTSLEKQLKKEHIKLVSYDLLTPFIIDVSDRIDRCDQLLVLESYKDEVVQGWMYKEILATDGYNKAIKQNAWYHAMPDADVMQLILTNFKDTKTKLIKYWVDVPYNVDRSNFPKHQVLLQELAREYPAINDRALTSVKASQAAAHAAPIPELIKSFKDGGAPYAKLSRFHTDTASFYDDPNSEMVAEPFQAVPLTPPSTFAFHSTAFWGDKITAFDASKCTACGACITACPHAAIPSTVLNLEGIIKAGIKMAKDKGEAIGAIVPALKIWAKAAAALALKDEGQIQKSGDLLASSFKGALKVAKGDKEKIAKLNQEFKLVMKEIENIPIALTDDLFVAAEKTKAGTGELFTLAIDPDSCTTCGWCIERCEPGALSLKDKRKQLAQTRQEFELFEQLPVTAPASVKKLKEKADFDPYAALLLDKDNYYAFVGKDIRFRSPHQMTLLRMILGQCEEHFRAHSSGIEKALNKEATAVNNTIKKLLADALPVRHLESLMDVLASHSEEKLSMGKIFDEWGQEEAFKVIERSDLQNKLQLVEDLKQWKWSLKEGLNGKGKAAYSIVIDESLKELTTYPWNAFKVPVLHADMGKTAELAIGMFEGQMRHSLDNMKLLRRASLEATNKYDPAKHNLEISGLSWNDLTEEERALIPPVFILGTNDILDELGGRTFHELFTKGYPIRLIVLEDTKVRTDGYGSDLNFINQALWPVVAQRNVYVAKTSLADSKEMYGVVDKMLTAQGPAVVSILSPDPMRFDIRHQNWHQLHALAVNTKAFIPWTFDPEIAGTTVASGIRADLPEKGTYWSVVSLAYKEGSEEKSLEYELSWADWAYLDKEWKAHFKEMERDANTVSIAAYLGLDEKARSTKVAAISRVNAEGQLMTYAVSDELIGVCKELTKNLDVLREWAGMFNEFPEKVQERVNEELKKEYEAEKKKLIAELAKEKKGWEEDYINQLKLEMKERLLKLSGN